MSNKRKYKKDSITEQKRKAWNRGKRILNATLSEVPTTGVTHENPKLPLLNSIYSHQTQDKKMKSCTDSASPFP